MLTELNGEPWNLVPPKDKAPQRQIKDGGTKGCSACFEQAKVHSPECGARFQDLVDNEAAQTAASASEPNVETPGQAVGGHRARFKQWPSTGCWRTRAGGCQHETEHDGSAKRQRHADPARD